MFFRTTIALLITVLCLVSSAYGANLTITYPPEGAVFPPDLASPPLFTWKDDNGADLWKVKVRFDPPGIAFEANCATPAWKPAQEQWDSIKRLSREATAVVTVYGIKAGAATGSEGSVTISTSTDPVGAPIFFREVPLPFIEALHKLETIKWQLGDVSSQEAPRTVLTNLPLCGNCHSFSMDGKTLAMDVDYGNDKGSYAIAAIHKEVKFGNDQVVVPSCYRHPVQHRSPSRFRQACRQVCTPSTHLTAAMVS